MDTEQDADLREEAKRLRLLPRKLQREAVAMIGSPASDPTVPAADRKEARRRAKALAELLHLTTRKK